MTSFFSALNPISANSNITFRAAKYSASYPKSRLEQTIPDLTLDVVIPFLWSRNLFILDGIFETFTVFYGDHFDKDARGFGQKGVLDIMLLSLPLLSRKLIADTYLEERHDTRFFNLLAWAIALPIETIRLGTALAFTIALIPVILGIWLFRSLPSCCSSDDPGSPGSPGGAAGAAMAMILPERTAFCALHVALHYLERMGIRNQDNVRRLLAEPENLALVYAMERLTHVIDAPGQAVFDFLFEHRAFWTDVRVIENLDRMQAVNQPFVRFNDIQNAVQQPVTQLAQQFNDRQSTHTASVHSSTAKSAARLATLYANYKIENEDINEDTATAVRSYDPKLVGSRTNQEILQSLNATKNRFLLSWHKDPESKVTSQQLFQYCWNAVNDQRQWREGVTQETATACFYATLYEIDREYALSEQGRDSGRSGAHQACEGGAFNKMIEGLAKIHKLCEVNFITPATAALKLPCVVRQELKAYIADNPGALEQLKNEGLSAIWAQLQPKVLTVMQRDFATIYPQKNQQPNPNLLALVDAGQDIDLTQELQQYKQEESMRRGEMMRSA